MQRIPSLKLVFAAAVALTLALAAQAQSTPGKIRALKLEGEVIRVAADGTRTSLTDGAEVTESDTVLTGAKSSAVLVFMNGASVRLGANSKLAIEEFKMDPLAEDIVLSQLENEPSVSQTKLNLAYGEMVGSVKHLNKSSGYSVNTPVGAAGIRGTTFRILLVPSADGKSYNFTLSTADGLVLFTSTISLSSGQTTAEVGASQEVNASASFDNNGNAASVSVSNVGTISESARNGISNAVQSGINAAVNATTFTVSAQNSGATTEQIQQALQELKNSTTAPVDIIVEVRSPSSG